MTIGVLKWIPLLKILVRLQELGNGANAKDSRKMNREHPSGFISGACMCPGTPSNLLESARMF